MIKVPQMSMITNQRFTDSGHHAPQAPCLVSHKFQVGVLQVTVSDFGCQIVSPRLSFCGKFIMLFISCMFRLHFAFYSTS